MAGKKPDYEVLVSRPDAKDSDKNFYTKIGAAWNVARDGISIQLQVLPLDGKVVLFLVRDDNSDGR